LPIPGHPLFDNATKLTFITATVEQSFGVTQRSKHRDMLEVGYLMLSSLSLVRARMRTLT
jgi:hypothetical protein